MGKREKICVIIIICLAAGVKLTSYDEGDQIVTGGFDLMGLLTQLFQYGLLAYFCYFYWDVVQRHLKYLRGPMPLALLVLASTLWSVVPSFTLRRGFGFFLLSLLAYSIGVLLEPAELCLLYVRALRTMVILSVLVLVFLRQYGISHGVHAGAWRGAFYDKNRGGEIMAIAFFTFAAACPMYLSRVQQWVIALVAGVLLYKSHSSTPVVALAMVLAAQAVWSFLMLRRKALIGILLAGYPLAALAISALVAYSSSIFKLLGKDSTFTGRDKVWAGVLDAVRMRPLLGYGYLAFWLDQGGKRVLIQEKTSFIALHAHNGYLNLLTHVGIIGLVLYLILFASICVLTIREGRRTRGTEVRWFFSFLVFFLFVNLAESQIVESQLVWITLIAFYTSLSIQRANRFAGVRSATQVSARQDQLALV